MTADFQLGALPIGGSAYATLIGRRVGTSPGYFARYVVSPTGALTVQLWQGSTQLTSTAVAGIAVKALTGLKLKLSATGTSPTTIQAKVWKATDAEPTAWTVTDTDTAAALQTAGNAGFGAYLPTAATNPSSDFQFDNFTAGPGPN